MVRHDAHLHRELRDCRRRGWGAEGRLCRNAAARRPRLVKMRPIEIDGSQRRDCRDARLETERAGPLADDAVVRSLHGPRPAPDAVVCCVVDDDRRPAGVAIVVLVDVRKRERRQRQQQCRHDASRVRSQPPHHASTVETDLGRCQAAALP